MLGLIEAGQNGRQHIQQKLAARAYWTPRLPTAIAFLNTNLLFSGYSFAVAEATPGCAAINFEAWHGNGGGDAKELLLNWIWEFINKSPTHICLIDEQESIASDPSWQDNMDETFVDTVRFSEGSIFYCVSSNTISQEKLRELIQSTFWFPFCCAFVVDTEKIMELSLHRQEFSEEQLFKLAQHTQGFVTDAYDLEGLLLWTKQQAFSLDTPF